MAEMKPPQGCPFSKRVTGGNMKAKQWLLLEIVKTPPPPPEETYLNTRRALLQRRCTVRVRFILLPKIYCRAVVCPSKGWETSAETCKIETSMSLSRIVQFP